MHAAIAAGQRALPKIDRFQSLVVQMADRCWRLLDRIARRPMLACAFTAFLPVALRLAALHSVPFPQPIIHDEFSYLLGAETFAAGRLTNPSPKMWQHFETEHQNLQPTFMTKYPPGQSLALAAGIRLFGHPWYGVLLSFGAMSGCLCWMLQGWLPRRYALLGALVAVGQIGIFGEWMNSYWGGAVAAAGGSLLVGAVPRLASRAAVLPAILGAFGMVVVGNSRPFEGFVTTVASVVVLLWWRRRRGLRWLPLLRPAIALPVLAICAIAGAADLYYNYRVTGNPLLMPYVVHQRTYSVPAQYFYWASPNNPPPVYRHEMLRKFYVDHEGQDYWKARHNPLHSWMREAAALTFVFSPLVFLAFGAGVILRHDTRIHLALAILGAVLLALALEVSSLPHYYAPVAGLFFLPVAVALRRLKSAGRIFGPALVLLFLLCAFGSTPFAMLQAFHNSKIPTLRQVVSEQLHRAGGRNLVIVRYTPEHNPHIDVVFNHADLDHADIIWARDMGDDRNRELVNSYPDRKVWLLEPDVSTVARPYDPR